MKRRRGSALDEAILEAAWVELVDKGYASFTMEAVAKRAGTSRPVLSRRWPGSAELAVAALGHYIEQNPLSVPDLGNVRDELVMLLRQISDRGTSTVARVLFGMRDYFVETNSSLVDLKNALRTRIGGSRAIDEIFGRAIRRGEIDPGKLSERIAALPVDLVRHEALMTQKPIPEAVIAEIVETIFLPLVTIKSAASR